MPRALRSPCPRFRPGRECASSQPPAPEFPRRHPAIVRRVRPRLLATGGFALVFLVLGVAGPAVHAQAAAPRPVATSVTTAPGSTCAGTAADRKGASIAWSRMKNPIFGVAGAGAKDESLTLSRGRWHLLMSSPTGDPVHWRIASATSHDLVHWSKLDVWPLEGGVRDPSSPDVIQRPDGPTARTSSRIRRAPRPRPRRRSSTTGPPATSCTGHGNTSSRGHCTRSRTRG